LPFLIFHLGGFFFELNFSLSIPFSNFIPIINKYLKIVN
jgi:hypothetical protein